jgi:hypothetical protein
MITLATGCNLIITDNYPHLAGMQGEGREIMRDIMSATVKQTNKQTNKKWI